MAEIRLLIGLGNPGKAYERTRHNLGFMVVREVARRYSLPWKNSFLFRASIAQGRIEDRAVCLALPQTMMNHSGAAVIKIVRARKIEEKNILVVSDDLNLKFGHLRVRKQGSDGGHNGLKSIIAHLASGHFSRVRLGVGHPSVGQDPAEYVLSCFARSEQNDLADFIQEAADCCISWITEGTDKIMNVYNKRKGNE